MTYLQYWKLSHAPFASTDANFFQGGSVEEAIARIGFLVKSRHRLGVLLGPASVGKTSLFRNLRKPISATVPQNRPRIVYLSLLGLEVADFYGSLARAIGVDFGMNSSRTHAESTRGRSNLEWTRLHDSLQAATALHNHVVLLLDDISHSKEPTLAGIHRIVETQASISCVLGVCSEEVGSLPDYLQERCQLRIDLPAWDLGQTADYFDFAIGNAKGRQGLFEAQAITRIHELSDGLPQRINRLSELALVAGAPRRLPRITSDLVDQVFDEFSLVRPANVALT